MICRFGWPIGSKAWEDRKVGGAPKITHGITTHSATMGRTVSAPPGFAYLTTAAMHIAASCIG